MQVLKNGSVSTLAIIDGIKERVEQLKAILPENLNIALIGDQSVFVEAAVSGVIHEGIIAAALTSLMILIFLGSWRSTVIIAISIPLSILGALAILWTLGETLNIMTLGGLALAVGILVDDATVTIENINWHLEQGKEVETAILDGAAQIVTPAFVSLLCICIVFVPMFFLQGVARFLFVPMAEAVMAAMVCSFILSRTLVPTMANYLLRKHAHGIARRTKPPTRNPLVRFQRGFERRFERFRHGYRELLMLALAHRAVFVIGFLAFVAGSFALTPFLGRDFFPSVDAGQILMHARTRVGTRVEESANQFAEITKAIRQIIPPEELATIVDNIGMPVSGINMTYNNTGTIGTQDGDIQIKLREGHRPTAEYVRRCARSCRALPRRDLLVPAGRHHQPDPELRRAGADRPADPRAQSAGELRLRAGAAAQAAARSGPRRRAHPAVAQQPGLRRRSRPHARAICRRHRARRDQQHGGEPRRLEPGRRRPTGSIPTTACRIRS